MILRPGDRGPWTGKILDPRYPDRLTYRQACRRFLADVRTWQAEEAEELERFVRREVLRMDALYTDRQEIGNGWREVRRQKYDRENAERWEK